MNALFLRKTLMTALAIAGAALGSVLASMAAAASLPSCHALDGIWQLQLDRSNLGSGLSFNPYFAINAVELSISTNGAQTTQRWRMRGPHLDRITDYTFSTDGTRRDTGLKDPMDFEYGAISADWQNCTLIQTGYSALFGLEVITTNTYVVSGAGDELTILQFGESPIALVDHRLVFHKAH